MVPAEAMKGTDCVGALRREHSRSRLEPDGTRREGGGGQPPVTQDPRGFSFPVNQNVAPCLRSLVLLLSAEAVEKRAPAC